MAYLLAENRFPDRWELDAIAHGHPILISTQTLHGCALNSAAMDIAKVPDIQGVVKNGEGVPTGVSYGGRSGLPHRFENHEPAAG